MAESFVLGVNPARNYDASYRESFIITPSASQDGLNNVERDVKCQMGCTVQKCVYWHMLTGKVQISLCIHAVWSGPSLPINRINGYYRMNGWRAKAQMVICACAGWSESGHFVQRQFFTWCSANTVNSRYLEFQGPLWNTSRYPYFDVTRFAELRKN